MTAFRAHELRCSHVKHLSKHRSLIVTLGEDDPSAPLQSTSVKIWDAERLRLSDKDAAPPLLRTVRIFVPPKFPDAPISAFDVIEEGGNALACFAGHPTGLVTILRADVARERTSRTRVAASGDGTAAAPSAVAGIAARADGRSAQMFCATATQVLFCDAGAPASAPRPRALDMHGCAPLCAAAAAGGDFVVGRWDRSRTTPAPLPHHPRTRSAQSYPHWAHRSPIFETLSSRQPLNPF